ncbi:MAG TPA: ABC transporter permease [Longimicrobium sp.]|jgi:lipopolysaccharide transport system permease protein|uniref:ABC transporter permease n=1 Tax=Longimicrobium sp. TaxID=2029185 RepID=UPI002EDAAE42
MTLNSHVLPMPGAGSPPRGEEAPTLVIEPSPRFPRLGLRELWAYRGLFLFLVWRDIKVRYAQTVLGAGWAILQPALTTVVFSVVFGLLARVPSDGVPYPVFALTALVPWTYFASALTSSSNSLVSSTNLITKVYFPRLVIPLAPVLAGLMDFAVAFGLLLAVMLAYGMVPSLAALAVVPLLLLCMILTAAGVGCWMSALNIQYRDVKHVVPFLLQVWMYASPILYPASLVPERWRMLYALNPMVGVVEGFRAALLQTRAVSWGVIAVSCAMGLVLLLTGALYFRKAERVFADVA